MSDKPDHEIAKARDPVGDLSPIAPGFVRPLTDPEAVERWWAMHEPSIVDFEYNPFANDRIR